MFLRQVFDPFLAQYAYLIGCQRTGEALIIDPERDIDRYIQIAHENGLRISAVAETHIHADFVSGAREFAEDKNIKLYISGEGGADWSYKWTGDRPNTYLLKDGESFSVGNIKIDVIHTPGHTPEHICFLVTDLGGGADQPMALFSGDFLFVGDVGRPDLLESAAGIKNVMEPSARALASSLRDRLSKIDDYVQVLPAHGAGSACGKSLGAVPFSTMGYERQFNNALKLAMSAPEAFVKDILTGQPEPPLYFATMKRVNRDGIRVTKGVPRIQNLSADEFSKLALDGGVRILDTRENKAAFDEAHVPRSISAPLRLPFFSVAAGSYLGEEDKILLVIEKSEDADIAVRQLYRIGFDNLLGFITFDEAKSNNLTSSKIPRIDFAHFSPNEAIKEGSIIDVRTTAEYERGHLEGAITCPYTRIKTQLGELKRDRRLFVHCASGRRATLAASFLRSEGFDVVHVDGSFRMK